MSPTSTATSAFYNDTFCDVFLYNDDYIYGMQDSGIEVEHNAQRVIKVLTTSVVGIYKDESGVEQLPASTIMQGDVEYDIISWQYHGNQREEILLIIEGDSRGR